MEPIPATKVEQESFLGSHEVTLESPLDLLFDSHNPRLVELLEDGTPNQEKLAVILWENMAIDELVMSISASGYFPYEPLIAIEEEGSGVVIEGNRRLAALKLLLDPSIRKKVGATGIPRMAAARIDEFRKVPVVWTTRTDAWNYIGFKHVNGPVKWNSYSKAKYIAEVHNDFGISLTEIAMQIGDKHRIVQRLYRALMVTDQAERTGVYHRSRRCKGHFSFSHLYTGLDYEGISSFIKLRSASCGIKNTRTEITPQAFGRVVRMVVWR